MVFLQVHFQMTGLLAFELSFLGSSWAVDALAAPGFDSIRLA